jgi:hypothetical protein
VTFPPITEAYAGLSATGIAGESAFGTAAPPTTFQPQTTNSFEVDPGWFTPEVMQGVRDGQIYNLYGEATYNGTIGGPVFPSNGIPLLVYAIGTDVVSGTTAPYTHTVSQANQLKSVTVEKNIGGVQSLRFAGVRISKLTLKAAAGNTAAEISADGVGQSAAIVGTPAAVSTVNELGFVFAEASVTLFGNLRADVSAFDMTIDNTVKGTYTFSGQHGPSFVTPTKLHVNGTIDVVWSSLNAATYGDFTSMVNGTLGALSFGLAHPVAANGSITTNCPQVVLSKFSNDLKIGDVVMATLNYEASKTLPSGNTINAVITNGVSTAY